MRLAIWLCCMGLVVVGGCRPSAKSGRGFTLPEGDVEQGRDIFVNFQCHACHVIQGIDRLVEAEAGETELSIALGGKTDRVKTYGQLVTSIINPSHRLAHGYRKQHVSVDGDSKMRNYNDVMTVQELTHLVTFLQSNYDLIEYKPTVYPMYGP